MKVLSARAFVGLFVLFGVWASPASAQSGANVLVVVNRASSDSEEIGDYYARKRAVPADQVLRIEAPLEEQVSRRTYESQIETPISGWLTAHAAQDRILYLVITKGVPLRIAGTAGPSRSAASVDSELTLLYRKMTHTGTGVAGSIANPYFLGDRPLATAEPFTHKSQDVYMTTRLDGYSVADVKALIDRGGAPAREGRILLDGRYELTVSPGNRSLVKAADNLHKVPGWQERVVLDITGKVLRDEPDVLGYYSWGSNDRTMGDRHLNIGFVPGAIGGEFVSADARTFREPPAGWQVNRTDWLFVGSHQALIADLIHDGITGISGYIADPYITATTRPDILFPAYVAGFNLAESFYLATPNLGWQTVIVGDPLCAPFQTRTLSAADLEPAVDPTTELPQFLNARRLAPLLKQGIGVDVAKLFVKSEVLLARHDEAGAIQTLEQATTMDPSFIAGHLSLAEKYGAAERWDDAIDRYHRVLALKPRNLAALNNLAYALATGKHVPDEAFPFAKRAISLGGTNPEALDTLAWIYHLLGQDTEAEPLIVAAAKQRPGTPELLLHAAVILAANGNGGGAIKNLDAAVKIDATLNERTDVQELRKRLPAPPTR
jgi:uncharacterized protein (TIGR03790 family)